MHVLCIHYFSASFTDVLGDTDEIANSQPMSIPSSQGSRSGMQQLQYEIPSIKNSRVRPNKHTGQYGDFRSIEEIGENFYLRGTGRTGFFIHINSLVLSLGLITCYWSS